MKKMTLEILAVIMFVALGTPVFAQQQYDITFEVDMTHADPFNPATDDVYITGNFADWAKPGSDDSFKMEPVELGSLLYTLTMSIDTGEIQYKYFRIIDGVASWDNGEWTGDPNRQGLVTSEAVFHDVWGEISSNTVEVTFEVDMTYANPFNPESDDVFITGNFAGWVQPGQDLTYKLEPVALGSMFYTLTVPVATGEIVYKYFRIIDGEPSWDNGEWTGDPNREGLVETTTIFHDVWGLVPGAFNVTYVVDMTYADFFNPVTDDIYISGTVNDWTEPGTDAIYKMEPFESDSMFYSITLPSNPGLIMYKYFRVIMGAPSWDNPEWGGDPNREVVVNAATTIYDVWGDILDGVVDIPNHDTFSLFPNPASNCLTIASAADVSKVEIYDVTGKMVMTVNAASENVTLNVSELNTGMYFVNVTNQKGVQTSKFVKN